MISINLYYSWLFQVYNINVSCRKVSSGKGKIYFFLRIDVEQQILNVLFNKFLNNFMGYPVDGYISLVGSKYHSAEMKNYQLSMLFSGFR